MNTGLFVISDGSTGFNYSYYARHGEFKGKSDVISYSDISGAKKFYNRKEAEDFIASGLPEWARNKHNKHKAVEVSEYDLFRYCPKEYVKFLNRIVEVQNEETTA